VINPGWGSRGFLNAGWKQRTREALPNLIPGLLLLAFGCLALGAIAHIPGRDYFNAAGDIRQVRGNDDPTQAASDAGGGRSIASPRGGVRIAYDLPVSTVDPLLLSYDSDPDHEDQPVPSDMLGLRSGEEAELPASNDPNAGERIDQPFAPIGLGGVDSEPDSSDFLNGDAGRPIASGMSPTIGQDVVADTDSPSSATSSQGGLRAGAFPPVLGGAGVATRTNEPASSGTLAAGSPNAGAQPSGANAGPLPPAAPVLIAFPAGGNQPSSLTQVSMPTTSTPGVSPPTNTVTVVTTLVPPVGTASASPAPNASVARTLTATPAPIGQPSPLPTATRPGHRPPKP